MNAIRITIVKNGYVVTGESVGGYMSPNGPSNESRIAATIDEALAIVREELEAAKVSPMVSGVLSGMFGGRDPVTEGLGQVATMFGVSLDTLQEKLREKVGLGDPNDPFNLGGLHPDNDAK